VSPLYCLKAIEYKSVTVELEAPDERVAILWAAEGYGRPTSFVDSHRTAYVLSVVDKPVDNLPEEEKKEQKNLT